MCRRLSSIQVETLLWSKWQLLLISLVRRMPTNADKILNNYPSNSTRLAETIQPICLPTSDNYNYSEMMHHSCQKLRHRTPARVRVQGMSVLPVAPQECSTLYHRKGASFSSREEFCAWDERVDTCTGDLGGPLVYSIQDKYEVIGLASYAHSKRVIRDPALPGVYVRVGKHTKWIKMVLEEEA